MRRSLFALCSAATFMIACERGPAAPTSGAVTPASSSAAADSMAGGPAPASTPSAARGRETVRVNILDACDPETFNAAIGPDTCVRNGGVTFDQFTSLLRQLHFVGPWHFAPKNANVAVGQTFVAMNMGGEEHTFTEVEQFGGGIVPILNQLGGFGAAAPECTALEDDDFVKPGGTYTEEVDKAGHLKFQCCIHPWMRLEATSK
jgi:plastocyanin